MTNKTGFIDSATLAQWLEDADEIALVDVREAGLFGEGHALLAVNFPYSRLEIDTVRLVPRRATRTVLIAEDDGAALRAAAALHAIGYTDVVALAGGTPAWRAAGQLVLPGVNVPSKAFAEFVEHAYHTPDIQPADLRALQQSQADVVLLDSRTVEEYRRFHVPGAISCPGSELPLRFNDLVPSPDTRVVISCAGRTRGVMGAQTLINLGVPNPVQALSGGTQGWKLAGLPLTAENTGEFTDASSSARAAGADRAGVLQQRFDVPEIGPAQLDTWRADAEHTTYVFDVRTEAEYLAGHLPGAVWVQGVQLVQCLDQWAAVRKARLVVTDDDGTRAIATAHWLRQLGWNAAVLHGATALFAEQGPPPLTWPQLPATATVDAAEADERVARGAHLIDVRTSADFRKQHPAGARWGNRARLAGCLRLLKAGDAVVVLGGNEAQDQVAQLFALSLAEAFGGQVQTAVLHGGFAAWTTAGLPTEATPALPAAADRIDFLFWLHDRHEGNAASSAAYLAWEAELPATLGSARAAGFALPA